MNNPIPNKKHNDMKETIIQSNGCPRPFIGGECTCDTKEWIDISTPQPKEQANYCDSRTDDEREADSKIKVTMTSTSTPPETDSKESWEERWRKFERIYERAVFDGQFEFIKDLLQSQREQIVEKLDGERKRTVSREHYPQITENKIHDRAIFNQVLDLSISIVNKINNPTNLSGDNQ